MSNAKITTTKLNDSFLELDTNGDKGIEREIYEHFSFKMPNAHFDPRVRKRLWDGMLHLFKLKTKTLPIGLWWRLDKFCKDSGYEHDGFVPEVSEDMNRAFAEEFVIALNPRNETGERIKHYDYQIRAWYKAAKYRRILLESSTSSGKSLIAYTLFRWFHTKHLKGLYIVPRVGLVKQLEANFNEYGYSDLDSLTVSTWQAIYDMPPEWFEQFDYVICDEVHTATAKEISGIMELCTKAQWKIGMTGSLQDAKAHRLFLEGLFGPVEKIMTNAEAMERKIAADLTVKVVTLQYSFEDKVACERATKTRKNYAQDEKIEEYQNETRFLMNNISRNGFIVHLAKCLNRTTVILTQSKKHAKLLYDWITNTCMNRNVYLVCGDVSADEREDIRQTINHDKSGIMVATYGTMQTGISIKNIHNVIFASSSKSKIVLLQSIGRALRISNTKTEATVWDIIDDLGTNCYSMKHKAEKLKLYKREKFKVEEIGADVNER